MNRQTIIAVVALAIGQARAASAVYPMEQTYEFGTEIVSDGSVCTVWHTERQGHPDNRKSTVTMVSTPILNTWQAKARCDKLQTAGLAVQSGAGYSLTERALATKPAELLKQLVTLAAPVAPPEQPDMHVDMRWPAMAQKWSIGLDLGKASLVANEVWYTYLGACMTQADLAHIRAGVAAHGAVDANAAAEQDAAKRLPHAPTADEHVSAEQGKWRYAFTMTPLPKHPDGTITLMIDGEATGPTNYDASAAQLCNGLRPDVQTAPVHQIVSLVPGTPSMLDVPILGKMELLLRD